jgi:hypothetical protein
MAHKQQHNFFCAVRANGCACSNKISHATIKQQLHCKRGTVFSTRSMPTCYKQNSEELVRAFLSKFTSPEQSYVGALRQDMQHQQPQAP